MVNMCYGIECEFYFIDEIHKTQNCLNTENCYKLNRKDKALIFYENENGEK